MCLKKFIEEIPKQTIGWKIVKKINGEYFTGLCNSSQVKLPKNKWVKDPNTGNVVAYIDHRYQTYPTGFNITKTRKEARGIKNGENTISGNNVIVKVAFKNVVKYGITGWYPLFGNDFETRTFITTDIKLLEEV